MTNPVFQEFWEKSSKEWFEKATLTLPGTKEIKPVKNYCSIKPGLSGELYKRYEAIKALIKDVYFKDSTKRLSCYKRAAVIAQVILLSDPLNYVDKSSEYLDPLFLKQRLAFCVALDSIIQVYPKEHLDSLEKPFFKFGELDTRCQDEDDYFVMSVYKDMFYAELYKNYNVLTMANIFGLLTERVSTLSTIEPRIIDD